MPPQGHNNGQAAVDMPSTITADGTRHVAIEDDEVAHVGGYAIWFRRGCEDCRVQHCLLHDLGAGGVRVGQGSVDNDKVPSGPDVTGHCTVDNNIVYFNSGQLLIVTGTQGEENREIKAARREAEAIRERGLRGVRFYDMPIKTDRENTADYINQCHLLLVGTPKSNLLLGRIHHQLPVRVEGNAVMVGHRRFAGDDVGFRLIYPNPLNPRRYVVVCAGVTYKGLEGLGSITAPNWGWNTSVSEPDLLIADQRSWGFYPRYLAALTFNDRWQWEDRGTALGRLEVPLTRNGRECGWGNFRADAIREATGADIALVEVDDHYYPLELAAGEVTPADLIMANNWSPVYTFAATGAQLRGALEHMIERLIRGTTEPDWYGTVRRPLAVSGVSYTFRRKSPKGERVAGTGLHPDKLYQVAVTEHILSQSSNGVGFGYLGWLPKVHRTDLNEVLAQTLYLRKRGVLKQVTMGRITEF